MQVVECAGDTFSGVFCMNERPSYDRYSNIEEPFFGITIYIFFTKEFFG